MCVPPARERLRVGSQVSISGTLDSRLLPRHSAAELLWSTWSDIPAPDISISWVSAERLSDGGETLVPAVTVWPSLKDDELPNQWWVGSSTGVAAHADWALSVSNAMYELAERDALAAIWVGKIVPALVPPELLAASPLVSAAREEDIITHAFDATTDLGVPVAVLVQVAPFDARLHFMLGAAAAADIPTALEKAASELAAARHGLSVTWHTPPATCQEFWHPHDGLTLMAPEHMSNHWAFLVEDPEPAWSKASGACASDEIVDRFLSAGHSPLVVDMTPPDVAEAGLCVTRVLAVSLLPMSHRPGLQYRQHPRLHKLRASAAKHGRMRDFEPLPFG